MKKDKIIKNMIYICVFLLLIGGSIVAANIFLPKQKEMPDAKINELTKDYYGILVLGSDEGATKTNGGDHTDSVTYLAVNKKNNKALAMPIYRDAFVQVTCEDNREKNINHIYRDNGAKCLKDTVEKMTDLPVDYQIYVTSDGFVELFNNIGPLKINPEESFCSAFGNNDTEYCFTEGESTEMDGHALLAYARYRGNSSGVIRANRHVQMLNVAYEACTADKVKCVTSISEQFANGKLQTDLPIEEAVYLESVLTLTSLGTVDGENFEDESGWHQRVNEDDLKEKCEQIKKEIFTQS